MQDLICKYGGNVKSWQYEDCSCSGTFNATTTCEITPGGQFIDKPTCVANPCYYTPTNNVNEILWQWEINGDEPTES